MSFARELEKPRRGRIHDMTQDHREEKIDAISFDFEKEIGEEERAGILSRMDNNRQKSEGAGEGIENHTVFFFDNVRDAAILFRSQAVRLPNLESYLKKKGIDLSNSGINFQIDFISTCFVAGEGNFTKNVVMADYFWPANKKFIQDLLRGGTTEAAIDKIARLMLIDSERTKREIVVSDDLWRGIVDWAEARRKKDKHFEYSYVGLMRDLKLIDPERFKTLHIEKQWPSFQRVLQELRTGRQWSSFAYLAASMAIMAAKEVRMTEHGIELVMPGKETHRENITKRPVRSTL